MTGFGGQTCTCDTTSTDDTWWYWNSSSAATTTATICAVSTATTWMDWNVTYRPDRMRAPAYRRRERDTARSADNVARLERAERWLLQHLNPEQEAQYQKDREFVVHSQDRQRRYLIDKHARVYELDAAGQRIRSFCIHSDTPSPLPTPDEICVKKILLESDETEFLRIANATALSAVRAA